MAISPEVGGAIAGALFLIGNILGFWFREWRKHKTWNKNGKVLTHIEKKIDDIDEKMEEIDDQVGETTVKMTQIGTIVSEQKQQCTKTVKRFDEAMRDQAKEMMRLAKGRQ